MKVTFWGVRGSIPSPLSPQQLQNRIAAVVERVQPHDLASQDRREAFLAHLPPYLIETIGGNTTCIEVKMRNGDEIIIDAGSGIRELGRSIIKRHSGKRECHIFFTHFHWDHIQGLPFFEPAFMKGFRIHIYSPVHGFESILRDQMKPPFFPVTMDVMQADITFHELEGSRIQIGGNTISWRKMKHPGDSYSYRYEEDGTSFIFSTDTELTQEDFIKSDENSGYFQNANLLVIDSQYTLGEAIEKYDWGHSSYSLAVDFAAEWGIEKLVLFHHEPKYEDKKMFQILKSAGWYKLHLGQDVHEMQILLAREGLELEV